MVFRIFSNKFRKKHKHYDKINLQVSIPAKNLSPSDVLVLHSLLKGVEGDVEKRLHNLELHFYFSNYKNTLD